MISKFNEYSKKNLNESLAGYVRKTLDIVSRKGGNEENLEVLGPVSDLLDMYSFDSRGEEKIYSKKTLKLFSDLVDSMANDEIENNQIDN
jgi:hypothetical protein